MQSDLESLGLGGDGEDLQFRPLRPFPEGGRSQVLEHTRTRLILLLPAGPSRESQETLLGLIAMNLSFLGALILFTSLAQGAQRGFLLIVWLAFGLFSAVASTVPLRLWTRRRFMETWILVEATQITTKRTLFGRSKLKTYLVRPDTVARFVTAWSQERFRKEDSFNVLIPCERQKLAFGDLLSFDEKRWILDEINLILRGDFPRLRAVRIRENKFEFVPDEIAPDTLEADTNAQVTVSGANQLEIRISAKPRRLRDQLGWAIALLTSTAAVVLITANLFTRWWFARRSTPELLALSAVPFCIAVLMSCGSAAILFVNTKIVVDSERLTRCRKYLVFARTKSMPTPSIKEIVIVSPTDPRGFSDGKARWLLNGRGVQCIARSDSNALRLGLCHDAPQTILIGGLVRGQLGQLGMRNEGPL
jgi:hypothetical protein